MRAIAATRRLAILAALALTACGGDSPPASVQPIQAEKNVWTWVEFPDSSCGDGTVTGIGVNPGDSPNLLVFLEGGGACWSYATCFGGFFITTDGPFGRDQLTAATFTFTNSVLDRSQAANPFRDWSLVYVPYCTGDVHAGSKVMQYADPQGGAHAFHHAGHGNVQAFLRRIAATFPDPPKLAVAGSSAGGFGVLANHETFRSFWPAGQLYFIDDSGPPLAGTKAQIDIFDQSWSIYQTLDAFCPACRQDLSNALPALSQKYPDERISLLSYERDTVIPTFFGMTPVVFVERLLETKAVIDGLPSTRYFLVGGTALGSPSGHTVLRDPGGFSVGGVGLWSFLGDQVGDAPNWNSHAEP